jgi:uncharacterized protein
MRATAGNALVPLRRNFRVALPIGAGIHGSLAIAIFEQCLVASECAEGCPLPRRGHRRRSAGRRGGGLKRPVLAALATATLGGGLLLALHLHRAAPPPALPKGLAHSAAVPKSAVPRSQPPPPTEAAWLRFAVPAPPAAGRPLVAVVIDDLGLDRRRTAAVIGLPGPLTLSFMTYAEDLAAQTAAGRRTGDELLLHVPMQPLDPRQDPGPHALMVSMSPAAIRQQLDWGLDRFAGFVGINNHMGSRFTGDADGMAVVMAELRRRGLLFLDSRTTSTSVGSREAAAAGVPWAGRDVFLDDVLTRPAIDRQLALVEKVARRQGSAIAIGHGHDPTIAALRAWLPTLRQKGLDLVPLSAVVRLRMREAGEVRR